MQRFFKTSERFMLCLVSFVFGLCVGLVVKDELRAQEKPEAKTDTRPMVKPLPAEAAAEFDAAQQEVELRQAQFNAATLRGRNALKDAAIELGLPKSVLDTCGVDRIAPAPGMKPVWSFVCQPPKPAEKAEKVPSSKP
jgi:hypothetical protein